MEGPKRELSMSASSNGTFPSRRHSLGTVVDGNGKLVINSKAASTKGTKEETYSIQMAIDALGFRWFQIKMFLVTGMCLLAESIEIMMVSILGPILRCEMLIPQWQQALLSMLVMCGMLISSGPWGALADRYGRKQTLIISTLISGYFGVLTSLSPNFEWVAINRFMVGISVGSFPQTMTFFSEFLPCQARTAGIVVIEVFFSFGAAVEVILAKLVMPTLGWRYLLAFSSLPVLVFPFLSYFVPESPHYLISQGRYDDTAQLLERMAWTNGRSLPPGRLRRAQEDASRETQTLEGLFSPKYRRPAVLLMMMCLVNGILFYGMTLLVPSLLVYPDGCHGSDIVPTTRESCVVSCQAFTEEDYNDIIITGMADLPGLLIVFVIFTFLGRRSALVACLLLFSATMLSCNICMRRHQLTALLFFGRAMANGVTQSCYIVLTEAFPTYIRGSAVGLSCGMGRVGAMIAPLVAQVGTTYSAYFSITCMGVLGLCNVMFASLLPPINQVTETHSQDAPVKCEEEHENNKRLYDSMRDVNGKRSRSE